MRYLIDHIYETDFAFARIIQTREANGRYGACIEFPPASLYKMCEAFLYSKFESLSDDQFRDLMETIIPVECDLLFPDIAKGAPVLYTANGLSYVRIPASVEIIPDRLVSTH